MLSVVVPVYNEKDNIRPLLEEIREAGRIVPVTEAVLVDDCSDDGSAEHWQGLKSEFSFLRVVRHSARAGQSMGLWSGISAAKGSLIVTLDGDGQNNPADIPLLFELYKARAGINPKIMVAGQRTKRNDNWPRRFSSRAANKIRAFILKDGTRDTGCSLKLFRREDYLNLPYFNHMHRYLPALMKAAHVEIHHVDVSHRPRGKGISKYGFWGRLGVGIFDLFGVWWLLKRAKPDMKVTEFVSVEKKQRQSS